MFSIDGESIDDISKRDERDDMYVSLMHISVYEALENLSVQVPMSKQRTTSETRTTTSIHSGIVLSATTTNYYWIESQGNLKNYMEEKLAPLSE